MGLHCNKLTKCIYLNVGSYFLILLFKINLWCKRTRFLTKWRNVNCNDKVITLKYGIFYQTRTMNHTYINNKVKICLKKPSDLLRLLIFYYFYEDIYFVDLVKI